MEEPMAAESMKCIIFSRNNPFRLARTIPHRLLVTVGMPPQDYEPERAQP